MPRKKKAAIIAVANQKGGVAKTTSVASLAAAFAEHGKRVLLVELFFAQPFRFPERIHGRHWISGLAPTLPHRYEAWRGAIDDGVLVQVEGWRSWPRLYDGVEALRLNSKHSKPPRGEDDAGPALKALADHPAKRNMGEIGPSPVENRATTNI